MIGMNIPRKRIIPPAVAGIIGGNTLEEVARNIQLQKAQDAANPPDPYSEEELRKQIEALGNAPEVSYAPDAKFDASADPSGILPAALGIALQTYMKNKQAKQEQAAKEYDKKMARIEKQADMIGTAKFKQYLDNNDPDVIARRKMDTFEFEQKQKTAPLQYQLLQKQVENYGQKRIGAGGTGGSGKTPVGDQPDKLNPTLTKEQQKQLNTFESTVSSDYDKYAAPLMGQKDTDGNPIPVMSFEEFKAQRVNRLPYIKKLYEIAYGPIQPQSNPTAEPSKREKILQFISNVNASSAVSPVPAQPSPAPVSPEVPNVSAVDVGKEILNKGISTMNRAVESGKRIIPNALDKAGSAVTTNVLSEPIGMVDALINPWYPYATREDYENAIRVQELLKKRGR